MFLFRCCLRVDCGCQNEPETEASRSSHSSHDYLRPYEKQIQCRLLPQPVDTSSTKHFADYSGCSHTSTSHSLLVGSTQSVNYEEVLLVSVSPGKQSDELIYADVSDDSVICKPPCSSGIINDKFSPDTSAGNNNLLPQDTNGNIKLVQDGGSDVSSNVSSASSGVDDESSAEVRYIGDIRQFQPTRTSVRPHGEECCCPTCQSVSDLLIHHSGNLKCLCKSCRDFYSGMRCITTNSSFTAPTGDNAFINKYRLMSGMAQDGEDTPQTLLSKFSKIRECASSDSQNFDSAREDATHSDRETGALASEVVDDHNNGLLSSDDELHYVFHKFIDNSCLEEPFTVSANDKLSLNMLPSKVVQLESDTVQQYTSSRTADDLEVAFFMFGNISLGSPSAAVPDESYVSAAVPALSAVSSEHETAVSDSVATSATVRSFNIVTKPSAFSDHENSSSTVESGSEQYIVNICSDVETGTSASIFGTSAGSGSPSKSENLSGALRIEESEIETDMYGDTDVLDNENQQMYSQSPNNEMQRDVIVQNLSDSLSFFIEFPAADDEHVSDVSYYNIENIDMFTTTYSHDTTVEQECSPGEDDVIIGQSLEIVTPECVIEHPVSIDEVQPSSRSADDVGYGDDKQFASVNVTSYIHGVVANAVQQIADDTDSASEGMCNVASENISNEWPKQIYAPLPYNWLQVEYGSDGQVDSLPGSAAVDAELWLASETGTYCLVGTTDVNAFETDENLSSGNEAICMTIVEAQDVPRVENYLISYDVHQSQQQLIDDDSDSSVSQTLMWSSDSACADKKVAGDDYDDIKLAHLVRPLEHVAEGEQGVDAVIFPPADIVEDFFMHYVLPVHSVGYSVETNTATAAAVTGEQFVDVVDQSEVDHIAEDVVGSIQLENAVQSDIVISAVAAEADVEADGEASAVSTVLGVPYIVQHELHHDEEVKKLVITAEAIVNVVVNDAIADTDSSDVHLALAADEASTSADGDTRLVVPSRSSCLLQSPSEPHRKKSVHFADMHGLQLETVQHYHQSPEPDEPPASLEEFLSKLSAAAAERRAKWTEHHPSRVSSWLCNSSIYLLACFELPSSQEHLLERVQRRRVALESCSFDDVSLAISGVVCVANIAYNKMISVRYTVNHWMTHTDVDGEYIPRSNDGPTDRFSFAIILPSRKQFVIGSEAEFAICYVAAGDGLSFEFWDNNYGRNYVVRCCSKGTSSDVGNITSDKDCTDNDDSEEGSEKTEGKLL